ncbi:AAA family ATPase [Pseudomonas putida]|uniref:ATP-binding protein n=1 Tax=Pseudomonas putida TaxID=303 RepID=UPI002A1F4929|nr:AAA family ATPase [Pseudomonas putida]
MKSSTSVYEVFTPTTPAKASFIEREEVNDKLVDALRTPGTQLVVYGYSGSGKSTLLRNKLRQLYEHEVTTRCTSASSFDQLMLSAFDDLNGYYISELQEKHTSTISASAKTTLASIRGELSATASASSESSAKKTRILPPQLTAQNLAKLMGEANCCWVLEDFHKIEESERTKLSQTMKVFMDMADDYKAVKVIAVGAVDSARQVVQYDPEMRTRIAEIHVPLMEPHELQSIINLGTKILKIAFSPSLTNKISHYANGLPAICHTLCLNVCQQNGIYEEVNTSVKFTDEELEPALKKYLSNSSDTLKMAFEASLKQVRKGKYDHPKLIIHALAQLSQDGATKNELLRKIKKVEPTYTSRSFSGGMEKLCNAHRTPLIRFDENSGKYSFIDPLYRSFALALNSEEPKTIFDLNIQDLLENVIFKITETSIKSQHARDPK